MSTLELPKSSEVNPLTEQILALRMEAKRRLGGPTVLKEIATFTDYLRETYSDAIRYRVYHVLAGSTPRPGDDVIESDFPGADSVLAFVRSLAKDA